MSEDRTNLKAIGATGIGEGEDGRRQERRTQ